jgi:aminocarboxymuconate-semialdehyde decarboxylase
MPTEPMSSVFPTIDVHAHAWLPEVQSLVAGGAKHAAHEALERLRWGTASAEISARRSEEHRDRLSDPGVRIEAMTTAEIDVQVVSIAPTQYHPWAGPSLAWEIAQATNEGIAAHCAAYPERLSGLGVVPLQYPELAVTALDHAVFHCGLRGVAITSHVPDPRGGPTIELSDPRLDALWRRAEELNAVIFLHPWGCTLDARLDRWYLSNSVGQPVEHAVALSHLIFGGIFDRFPGLRLIAAHGGGYLTAFAGRNDQAWRARPEARSCRRLPSSYLRSIYFDSLVYTPDALRGLIRTAGSGQVMLGSDYPYDMGVEDPVRRLEEAVDDPVVVAAIKGGNAAVLNLLPAAGPVR